MTEILKNKSENSSPAQEFYANITSAALMYNTAIQQMLANNIIKDTNLDPLNVGHAFMQAATELYSDPNTLIERGMELAQDYATLWNNTAQKFLGNEIEPTYQPDTRDQRFKDQEWQNNPVFDFIKQSYLLNSCWLKSVVKQLKSLDPKEYRKLDFYTKLLIDAMAPSNFIPTNPEVLKEIFKTNGANLVKGVENLLKDIAASKGNFQISTANTRAFEVGKNLAVTQGKVVFQNDLIQLIQYRPATTKVYKTSLLIMPAWINKYYILDLQQKNSMVKWLVEQGFTIFMISWVNPSSKHSNKTFSDYMDEGAITALKKVQEITNESQVNFMGYCLGGTLLACTIAYLKTKQIKPFPIKSASFLTSLVDFKEAGDLSIFIDDEQLSTLESRMSEKGYLDGSDMARTFSMIRANDMIWSFYINNYLMGKDPLPFDILYWNSDSTRLPAKMHIFYLRNMYQHNLLIKPNGISLDNTPIDLRKNDLPTYILATIQDHIVPWESAYHASQIYTGPVRFTLSGSGHVAGVMNNPANNKYNYWSHDKIEPSAKKWLDKATNNEGSWWNDWIKWAAKLSGEKIKARNIDPKHSLQNAPGSYVKARITPNQ